MANWSRLSLPSIPAPAAHRLADTVLSYWGTKPSRMWLAAVVCTPLVQNRSFIPIGTPAILPSVLPAARSASTALAASSARSGVVTINALRSDAAATLALNASAISRALKSPFRTPLRIDATPRSVRSTIIRSPWAHRKIHVPPPEHWPGYRRGDHRRSSHLHLRHPVAGAAHSE